MKFGQFDITVDVRVDRVDVDSTARAPRHLVLTIQSNPMGFETPISQSELRDLGHYLIRQADLPTNKEN